MITAIPIFLLTFYRHACRIYRCAMWGIISRCEMGLSGKGNNPRPAPRIQA